MAKNAYIDQGAREILDAFRRKLGAEWRDSDIIRWMAAEIKARADARPAEPRERAR